MPRSEQPLEGDGPLAVFAADLRALRRAAGSPPYRRLAQAAHYSSMSLADAAGGARLPSLAVTLAYVRACGGDPDEWEARWRDLAATLESHRPPQDAEMPARDDRGCPYVGLAAFGQQDAVRFFGRERLTEEVVARVRTRRFTAVFGASGSGKSSLLHAGLLPRLAAAGDPAGEAHWPVVVFAPGPHPLDECAARLAALTGGAAGDVHRLLREDPRALHLAALQVLADRAARADLLVVVDQFEEVFTLCGGQEREQFLGALLAAAGEPNSRVRVVVGVRADFYPHCAQHPELVEALRDAQVLVGPMNTEQLRHAISGPATAAGCTVQGALLARIVADAAGQPGVLPLVSHALRESWRRRSGNTLTLGGYEAAGGIHHALARTAEALYTSLDEREQELAHGILLRLVALGEGTEDTKRRVERGMFDGAQAGAVLDALAAARLVTLDDGTVELTHEALLSAWPRLRGWIEEDRAGLLIGQQLAQAAAAWEREGRDSGVLYRGERLAAATAWATCHHEIPLDQRSGRFLAASRRHARRSARLRRGALAALCALSLLAGAAALDATRNAATAQRNAQQAQTQRALALSHLLVAQSDALAADNPALARQLALSAWAAAPSPQAAAAISRLLSVDWQDGTITTSSGALDHLAFSPDGRLLAAAGTDGTVRVWQAETRYPVGKPIRITARLPRGVFLGATALAFSPDDKILAVGAYDSTVRLWDLGTGHITSLFTPTSRIVPDAALTFSPDGKTLAVAGRGPVILWDRATGRTLPLAAPRPDTLRPPALAFSPNGTILAISDPDGSVQLWDPAAGRLFRSLINPERSATAAAPALAFSPDGSTLAIGGNDTTVQLWDPATGHKLTTAALAPDAAPKPAVHALAFSPDSRRLTFTDGTTIQTWDRVTRHTLAAPTHLSLRGVASAVFSRGARILAITGDDGAVHLWDPATGRPLGAPIPAHTDPAHPAVSALAFAPNGTILAAGSDDGAIQLWNPATGQALGSPLRGEPAAKNGSTAIHSLAFSPAGKILAAGSYDGSIQLWNPAAGALLRTLAPPLPLPPYPSDIERNTVQSLAFSPDGTMIAAIAADGTARLRNPVTGALLGKLTPQENSNLIPLPVLAFSRDGRILAVDDDTSGIRLWNTATGRTVGPPLQADTLNRSATTLHLVLSDPDGRVFALHAADGTQRLWDPAIGSLLPLPHIDPHPANSDGATRPMAFSHNGRMLAFGTGNQTTTLWDPAADRALAGPVQDSTNPAYRVTATAFSPDGTTLATAANDGTLNLWPIRLFTHAYTALCADVGTLSHQEWNTYAPGEPQPTACTS